jgi:phenylalanyl-tRNA synthetase alpha chain
MDVADALRKLEDATRRGVEQVGAASTLEELEEAERSVLGRKGPVAEVQRSLGELPEVDRRTLGRAVNDAFQAVRDAVATRQAALRAEAERAVAEKDRIDVTLPGLRPPQGGLHPLTQTERRIVDAFVGLGYRLVEGPELETDWYNFESLNIPPDHPARTEQDTLYPDIPGREDLLLRTQTSNLQVRTMETQEPPIYVVTVGRCYRRDVPDATHSPVFHQVEGLVVDKGITMAHLKGTLDHFARAMFGPDAKTRWRPHYFPFTEPSAEFDVWFTAHRDGPRWVEWGGCGMVNPNVLRACGIDPQVYSGFAFGMGIERTLMFRNGLSDMREMIEGDVRFTRAFGMEVN